ncbi:hypothetical protein LD85_0393 [Saccharolobus islandicus L.D.8.5]|uniref:Uncharacterized protein n=1 Tax=Saccharolobus islandicus (strain L.D.8.5 / Lassen \|nr:hypothetical protein LD85_0393 [Sulfolobus islandicus L.D.8.5]
MRTKCLYRKERFPLVEEKVEIYGNDYDEKLPIIFADPTS